MMDDKVALIMGASSGIGWATGEAFASRGAKVVLAARREKELADLTHRIEERGGQASFVVADVAIAKDVQRAVSQALDVFGRLDYAVNNAGYEGPRASITEFPEEAWDQVIATNLKGPFLCMQYEARAMLAGGRGGAIVNVGSVNSFLGAAGFPAYCASKHGLIGLTTSVSAELAPKGIRVNLLCPGIIDTPMHQRGRALVGDALYDNLLATRVHSRRAGRPEEIARSIVFLCSDDASYITGTTLTPDGGFVLTI
jgi:NAD(P)-dependent dehydrogenase (short-subunit alcohol dehydrogenase family)